MAPKYIWDPGRLSEQQQFYMAEMGYTIAEDYDPAGLILHDSDPVAVYQTLSISMRPCEPRTTATFGPRVVLAEYVVAICPPG